MIRNRRSAILALATAAVLAIGVTAAWAGYPNMREADSTFDAGTTTKGGKPTAGSSAELAAAAAPAYAPATIYVHFKATGVNGSPTFVPYAEGAQTWACANWGGGWPADPKKTTAPLDVAGSQLTLTTDRNGKIIYTGDGLAILLAAPGGFACPNGQTALLVSLTLTKLVLTVVGFTEETAVDYPTSAGWVGNVYSRPGYSG